MIVRNLLGRLGIEPDSPQLRCIATSASLSGDAKGLEYLEQFFGVDRSSFFVTAGQAQKLRARLPIPRASVLEGVASKVRRDELVDELNLAMATAMACHDEGGRIRATTFSGVAKNLFDEEDDGEALGVVLESLSELKTGDGSIPIRAHMFARTLRGLWACSNPACDQVSRQSEHGIGRLFSIPASTCRCGGRVLELLYCFECGDISLGGYLADERDEVVFLTPSPVEVPAERAAPVFMRPHHQYRWYRPGVTKFSRTWSPTSPTGQVTIGFGSAAYDPLLGAIMPAVGVGTGTILTGLPPGSNLVVPALPVHCPRCDLRAGLLDGPKYFKGIVRSPIRAHTAGLAQSTQLLMTQLHRSMGDTVEDSRTIVFTDSRDDAARTASGTTSTTSGTSFDRSTPGSRNERGRSRRKSSRLLEYR